MGSMAERAAGWMILAAFCLCLATPAVAQAAWPPGDGRGPCAVTKQDDVEARMRDGVVLRADVHRPQADGPVPVILPVIPAGAGGAGVDQPPAN